MMYTFCAAAFSVLLPSHATKLHESMEEMQVSMAPRFDMAPKQLFSGLLHSACWLQSLTISNNNVLISIMHKGKSCADLWLRCCLL